MKDPIPLCHFGKWGILEKIDLMEDQFDVPMIFDEHWVPYVPLVPGQDMVPGVRELQFMVQPEATGERKTPSLMADMFGFASKEEMEDTKAYLLSHGWYQLEQVGE